jgi:hypothetical protein
MNFENKHPDATPEASVTQIADVEPPLVQEVLEDPSDASKGRLLPSVQALLDAPLADRARAILRDRVISYPALITLREQARWMFSQDPSVRASGLVVSASPGNGKTSLALTIQRSLQSLDGTGPTTILIPMAGVRDARTVYGRILERLGSPARVSHRISDREVLVTRLLQATRCRLLILDEVQDLLLGSEREQRRALEAVKLLMNELRLPVLAFGTQEAAQGFASDPHLAARFQSFPLPAWQANDVLMNFLVTWERLLPLREASGLGDPKIVAYLAKVSGGVLDVILKRVQNAALMALMDGSERITLELLKQAEMRPAVCALSNPT